VKFLSRPKTKVSHRRRSLALGLEPLEGRRLMATLAATTAFNTNPVIFTLGSDGTVFVNQQRPTNDPTRPYASAGLVALPGLQASSIAAFHTVNGFPEVVAIAGSGSYVYQNVEHSTNNPTAPFAWSGWQAIANFVATSIVAAQSANTAGLFVVGGDAHVYENVESTAAGGGTLSGYQIIPGFSAATLVAGDDGSDVLRVYGTAGPQSYISQATTTASFGSSGITITPSAWSQVPGNFVATGISEARDPSASSTGSSQTFTTSLFATGGDGRLYSSPMVPTGTGTRSAGAFQPVGNPSQIPAPVVASAATLAGTGTYQTIFALGNNGTVYENQAASPSAGSTNFNYSGWVALADLNGSSIVATPNNSGGPLVAARSSNGVTTYKQAAVLGSLGSPSSPTLNAFTNQANLAVAYHPLAVTEGPGGKPVVATIGNDGTVYVALDTSTGSSGSTTDSYSGFTALPGVTATSLAATTETNGIALFATVDTFGAVFVNQYRPTENVSQPYAWTGWTQVGTVTGQSIAAVTAGGSSNNAPTLFVNQPNGAINVYQSTPPLNEKIGYSFTQAPTTLNGLGAATLSAKATANGIEVASLTGPQSYAYVNLGTLDSNGQPTFSGWQQVGNYVANRVVATTGTGGVPAIAVNSSSGQQAFSEDLAGGGSSAFAAFRAIPAPFSTDPAQTAASGYTFQELASITYANNLGGAYFDVFSPKSGSVFGFGFTGSPQQFTGNPNIASIQVSSLATTPDFADPSLFAGGDDGRIYVNQGTVSNNAQNPYTYLGWVALGSLPS